MASRSQFLVPTGMLAVGLVLGSLVPSVLVPAVQGLVRSDSKGTGQKPQAARPADPPVAKEAPKVEVPVVAKAVAPVKDPKPGVAALVKPVAGNVILPVKKVDPEALLRSRGLRRSEVVYILEAEDELVERLDNLRVLFNRWEIIVARMDRESELLVQCQYQLASLESSMRGPTNAGFIPFPVGFTDQKELETLGKGLQAAEKEMPPDSKRDEKKDEKKKESGSKGKAEKTDEPIFTQGQDPYQVQQEQGLTQQGPMPGTGFFPGAQMPGTGFFPGGQMPGTGFHPGAEMPIPIHEGGGPHHEAPPREEKHESGHKEEHSEGKHMKVLFPRLFQARTVQGWYAELRSGILSLRNAYYADELQAMAYVQEFQWRRAAMWRFVLELHERYKQLEDDEDVLKALRDLNWTANPKLTLGPRDNYRENLAKMTERMLKNDGVLKDLRGKYRFAAVSVVFNNAMKAETELSEVLSKQKKLPGVLDLNKKQLAYATQKKQTARVATLLKDQPRFESELKAIGPDVAAKREIYVQRIADLRKVVDESNRKSPELEKEHKVEIGRINPVINRYLVSREAMITSREVPLEPDKAILWVEVGLNGTSSKVKMVLEPSVDLIRMSADLADTLGIKLDLSGLPENVTLEDGRKLPARRVTLKLVQVGSSMAENVECLVFLEGFEAPPLLGASFLNRFSYRVDPDKGTITLTQVDPNAHVKR